MRRGLRVPNGRGGAAGRSSCSSARLLQRGPVLQRGSCSMPAARPRRCRARLIPRTEVERICRV